MVLPLCEEDLRTFLAREGPRRGPSSFFRVVRQIAVGLAECHRQSVLHRDLNPGNELRQGARFMLADFGVADQLTPYRPLLTGLASTPMYWSLKQLRQEPYNTAVDLWALGSWPSIAGLGENPMATVRWSVGDSPTARPGIQTTNRAESFRMDEEFEEEGASTTVRG
ncbi:serine/threonine-protein kinase PkaB-like [Coccinella septempunctata]|uniref:serine/threonine-protein kinase PkaB-like n=1 Tax=Coccinella septempunctata TaxID=41139 RepID=UPI001D0909AE|nr:serine/threonine-protein kinase PkaB-like [Coccinella septempunctata]